MVSLTAILKKKFWRYEKFKKIRKMLRKRHYLQQQFESHFWLGKH